MAESDLRIEEIGDAEFAEIAAYGKDAFARVCLQLSRDFELSAPPNFGVAADGGGGGIFKIAPMRLLIHLAACGLAEKLTAAIAKEDAAAVALGNSYMGLRIAGRNARDLLARGLPIDLHPRAFPPGSFARSAMHHINVLIYRPAGRGGDSSANSEGDVFEIYIPRSFADSFCYWLRGIADGIGDSD